ncbi:MAG: protein kinase [Sinobacteraceae bacterium]|nr:protein kinase [Nevskiaceae bacterium]
MRSPGIQFNMDSPPAQTGSKGRSAWDTEEFLAEVPAPLSPGSVIRDRFVLVEELGRGGMGVVYKAYDRSRGDTSDRYVAIKVLNEDFKRHPLAVRALQREARKAQKLAHPNIVAVHDLDRDRGNVYMVMELLSGRALDDVILTDGRGGIPLGPAMEIIRSLGAALSYAHNQGIVHCDFKPSNAFMCSDGKVKVLDFGIARAVPSLLESGAEKTRFDAGQLGAISPAYASLEMLEQRGEPDVRDDVYAFACVAYEVISGCHPYQRIDAAKAYQSGLQPRVIRKLSRTQWRALRQGLEFRRADRCASIDSLVSQLAAPQSKVKLWMVGAAAGLIALVIAGVLWRPWAAKPLEPQTSAVTQRTTEVPASQPKPDFPDSQGAPAVSSATTIASSPPPQVAAPPQVSRPRVAPSAQVPSTQVAPSTQAVPSPGTRAPGEIQSSTQPNPGAAASPDGAPPAQTAQSGTRSPEQKRIDSLKEKFETQAVEGDLDGAAVTASALGRAAPGSSYVAQNVPQILTGGYVRLAKTQLANGQIDAALQTLQAGRRKLPRSPELPALQARYVDVAPVYDRLRSAVTLNVADMQRQIEALRSAAGDDSEATAQMLAQTLADRIADQRAANRAAVADRLLEAGKQIFPGSAELLQRGTAGVLADAPPIQIDDNGN